MSFIGDMICMLGVVLFGSIGLAALAVCLALAGALVIAGLVLVGCYCGAIWFVTEVRT